MLPREDTVSKDRERIRVWVQRFPDRANLVLQWHDPVTGKRRSESAKTADEKEAERKRSDKETLLNLGLSKDPNKTTWETFRTAFEAEHAPGKRRNTRVNYGVTLDHFERIVGVKRMEDIDARAVSRFVSGLRSHKTRGNDGQQASTIKTRLNNLKAALRWAKEQGMLDEVPAFPKIKLPGRRPQPVPKEQVDVLLGACGDDRRMRAYLLCAWLAGLRRNEAEALRWSEQDAYPWIDTAAHRIRFPAGFVKGDTDQWVPLDEDLEQSLLELPRRESDDKVFRFPDEHNPEREINPGKLSARVRRLARKAGVKLTYKTLRRGFGCKYAAKVSAQVLQKLMRHSNISITMAYYANVDDAVMDAVRTRKGKQ
jgi:integrase